MHCRQDIVSKSTRSLLPYCGGGACPPKTSDNRIWSGVALFVQSACHTMRPILWLAACERRGWTRSNPLQSSMAMFGRVTERIITRRTWRSLWKETLKKWLPHAYVPIRARVWHRFSAVRDSLSPQPQGQQSDWKILQGGCRYLAPSQSRLQVRTLREEKETKRRLRALSNLLLLPMNLHPGVNCCGGVVIRKRAAVRRETHVSIASACAGPGMYLMMKLWSGLFVTLEKS